MAILQKIRDGGSTSIATGLMGLGITLLGVILAYIWRSNGKLQMQMMPSLEHMEQGQIGIAQIVKEVSQIVKETTQMVLEHGKILERIESRKSSN